MVDDDFRFIVDPKLRGPVEKDRSFQIGGSLRPTLEAPLPRLPPSSPSRPESVSIVRQPPSKNSKAMERLTIRLSRELIDELDKMAAETHLSASAIVRQTLTKMIKRKRKSTSVK
jgi:hypothetical protein